MEKIPKNEATNDLPNIIYKEIVSLQDRIRTGRIRNAKNEEIRIKNLRTLGYLCKIYNEMIQKEKLDFIEKEIENLRLIVEKNGNGGEISK